ncbi:XRE family transcriptional regulator [Pedobacter frigidisoli]|uniref:XRE family transcriptional regulator n=1 Tax=Pedobacter frigidisoli TaxID=2530455 RepID=A0A4R0P6T0_9SPHI|nr:helix-turn-helix domain-containing protein [Pedobacter frigidisoli]TCD10179.1 XRE family transcriptional regulator [Pedobacter frigidisoli]
MTTQLKHGEVLERLIRRDRMGISELSRKLNVSRRTIYNWFGQDRLNKVVIWQVCKILGQDLSTAFPDVFLEYNPEQSVSSLEQDQNTTDPSSVYFWMNKYIQLLEKYNEILASDKVEPSKDPLKNEFPIPDKRTGTFLYQ